MIIVNDLDKGFGGIRKAMGNYGRIDIALKEGNVENGV